MVWKGVVEASRAEAKARLKLSGSRPKIRTSASSRTTIR